MTDNPNAKYGFGPKTRNGTPVIIDSIDQREQIWGSGRHWFSNGKYLLNEENDLDLIPLSELASSENKAESSVSVDTQGAVGEEAPTSLVDRLREKVAIAGGYGAHTISGVMAQAANEIERLQGELYDARQTANAEAVDARLAHRTLELKAHAYDNLLRAHDEAQATIAFKDALIGKLVECKDALLAQMDLLEWELHTQCASISYPAKATPEMVDELIARGEWQGTRQGAEQAIREILAAAPKPEPVYAYPAKATMAMTLAAGIEYHGQGYGWTKSMDAAINAALAAAPPDDRDARIAELERDNDKLEQELRYFQNLNDGLAEERDELKRQLDTMEAIAQANADRADMGDKMLEALRAKCPPDAALTYLDDVMTYGHYEHSINKPYNEVAIEYRAWVAGLDDGKTCANCFNHGNSYSFLCKKCHRRVNGTKDNWTPKEGA